MNTKSLLHILIALLMFMGVTEAQYSSANSTAVSPSKLIRNDNTITIYGKVYWHYVRISGAYYNCSDREGIVEAIKRLNRRVKISNERAVKYNELKLARNKVSENPKDVKDLHLAPLTDAKKSITEVNSKLLKDAAKPKTVKPALTSSLRQPPRKLKP